MKVTETTAKRVITLELDEDEAKKLRGIATWYPVDDKEDRTSEAEDFAWLLSDALGTADISLPNRPAHVKSRK
ncbi:hypothetical protein ACFV0L_10565 [Streptosporangium canum]|uniref:hypothetical protein n=1 Tax=Streptosporangium canum TaxID=324952 RepID=UPI00368CDE22